MAHTGIFATSDEILVKAGANYNVLITEARINALCLQAESALNTESRFNWSDAYAALDADVKGILAEYESDFVAFYIISFDASGYTSRTESQTMLDCLFTRMTEIKNLLKEKEFQLFIKEA